MHFEFLAVSFSYANYYYRAEHAERLFPQSTEHVRPAMALLHLLGLIHLQKHQLDREVRAAKPNYQPL